MYNKNMKSLDNNIAQLNNQEDIKRARKESRQKEGKESLVERAALAISNLVSGSKSEDWPVIYDTPFVKDAKSKKDKKKITRRGFLKMAAAVGVVGAGATVATNPLARAAIKEVLGDRGIEEEDIAEDEMFLDSEFFDEDLEKDWEKSKNLFSKEEIADIIKGKISLFKQKREMSSVKEVFDVKKAGKVKVVPGAKEKIFNYWEDKYKNDPVKSRDFENGFKKGQKWSKGAKTVFEVVGAPADLSHLAIAESYWELNAFSGVAYGPY